jgi:hypothetical protein
LLVHISFYRGSVSSLSASNTHITSELAVSIRGVGLTYTTSIDKKPTLKSRAKSLGRGKKQTRIVRALDDVNLDIQYGHVLGVIGTNGAGKSSLMRCVAGILPPSQGRIEVFGSVSTLLALGVGFNPSMSGRDNVFLGGLAAGMSREEIAGNFEEIAEFSELGDAIDAPMRTYSSGMYARLAFSVAALQMHNSIRASFGLMPACIRSTLTLRRACAIQTQVLALSIQLTILGVSLPDGLLTVTTHIQAM